MSGHLVSTVGKQRAVDENCQGFVYFLHFIVSRINVQGMVPPTVKMGLSLSVKANKIICHSHAQVTVDSVRLTRN